MIIQKAKSVFAWRAYTSGQNESACKRGRLAAAASPEMRKAGNITISERSLLFFANPDLLSCPPLCYTTTFIRVVVVSSAIANPLLGTTSLAMTLQKQSHTLQMVGHEKDSVATLMQVSNHSLRDQHNSISWPKTSPGLPTTALLVFRKWVT